MLLFAARLVADNDRPLAAALLPLDLDPTADLGHDRRILRLASLEDLGHARQATGDILGSRCLARRLGEDVTRLHDIPFVNLDVGFLGEVVEAEGLAVVVEQRDLGLIDPLVLHDHPTDVTAGILFDAHRLALDDVLVADLARHLREDRDRVRVPLDEHGARLDLLPLLHLQNRTSRNVDLLEIVPLGIADRDLTVAGEHDLLAVLVGHTPEAGKADRAGTLCLALVFLEGTLADAADVKRAHRQLRTWLADALGARRLTGRLNDGVGGDRELRLSALHLSLLAAELLVQLRGMHEGVGEALRHFAGLIFPRFAAVGGKPVSSAVVGGVGSHACYGRSGRDCISHLCCRRRRFCP